MKKIIALVLVCVMAVALMTACSDVVIGGPAEDTGTAAPAAAGDTKIITLTGSGAESKSGGVAISGSTVTIGAGGTYTVSGKLDNGQIVINTGDDPVDVVLVLDNADITNLAGPAILVTQAKNADIELAAGSTNRVVSGTEADMASSDDTKTGAAIFAEDDLDIRGDGTLEVLGYINSGITCKDDIDIQGGTVTVTAANNGIKGSESVEISACKLSVTAGNDGIKSTCIDKAGKGYVTVNSGDVSIVSENGDGISAETGLNVLNGSVRIETKGDPELVSAKGIKCAAGVVISGGEITVSSTDHALHSGAVTEISGGTLGLNSTVGKAIAGHGDVNISGGRLLLTSADDGIESKTAINISGGEITVTAGNDGLKAGEKATGFTAATGSVVISGGTTLISACADPIDAKASARVDGGTVFGLGYSKAVKQLSSGAEASAACFFNAAQGDTVELKDASGSTIFSLTAAYKTNAIIASGGLKGGQEYTVVCGSNSVTATAK